MTHWGWSTFRGEGAGGAGGRQPPGGHSPHRDPPAVPSVPPPGGTSKGSPPGGHFPGALGGNAPSSPFCSVPKSATGALGPRRATKGNLVALLPAAPPAPTEHHGGSAPPCASPCPRLPPKRRRGGSPGSPPAAGAHALFFTSPLRPGGSARHELFPLPSADGEATRQLTHPTQLQKSVLTPSLLLLAHAASRRALRALFQPSAGCSGCSGPCTPRSHSPIHPSTAPRPEPLSSPHFSPSFNPNLAGLRAELCGALGALEPGVKAPCWLFPWAAPADWGEKGKKWWFWGCPAASSAGCCG